MELKLLETKLKSDIFLQVIVFSLSAALVSLLAIRIYPKDLLHPKKPNPTPPPIALSNENSKIVTPPNLIFIPSLEISLPIAPGVISNNQWTLYDDKVSWLSTSNTPGDGNVILYAHNRQSLFGPLDKLEEGAIIEVFSASGEKYSYQVREKREVLPNDLEAILSSEDQLTLYTCEGSFDEKRLIVKAFPLEPRLGYIP